MEFRRAQHRSAVPSGLIRLPIGSLALKRRAIFRMSLRDKDQLNFRKALRYSLL
jgi:hypothetical protein